MVHLLRSFLLPILPVPPSLPSVSRSPSLVLPVRYTWDCRIDARGDMHEAQFKWYESALCSQFIAHACSYVWRCCDFFDPMIWRWVEARSYGTHHATEPLLPIPACVHDPADKKFEDLLCKKCQGNVIVNFKVHPEWCYFLASEYVHKITVFSTRGV